MPAIQTSLHCSFIIVKPVFLDDIQAFSIRKLILYALNLQRFPSSSWSISIEGKHIFDIPVVLGPGVNGDDAVKFYNLFSDLPFEYFKWVPILKFLRTHSEPVTCCKGESYPVTCITKRGSLMRPTMTVEEDQRASVSPLTWPVLLCLSL